MNKEELKFIRQFNKKSFEDSVIKLTNNIETFAQGSKFIAITSVSDYFYETILSYYLAKAYVDNNKKALVIETNYIEPLLQDLLASLDEEIKDDSKEIIKLNNGIDVVFSKKTKFSAEELHSKAFEELIKNAKKTYDYIILLVTPLGVNNDLFALNKVIDISLLVAKKDKTILADLYQSVEKIKINKLPFLGVTLIK